MPPDKLGAPDAARYLRVLSEEREFVQRIARALVMDSARADDVVQLVWMAALKHRPDPKNLRPWLRVVTRAVAHSQRRTETRARRRERTAAEDRKEQLLLEAHLVDQEDTRRKIRRFVEDLEEPYRATVLLHFFEGLASEEIAKRLGAPASTIRNRLRRGLAQLRVRLESHYGDRGNWAIVLVPLALEGAPVALPVPKKKVPAIKLMLGAAALWKLTAAALVISLLGFAALISAPKDSSQDKDAVATSSTTGPNSLSGQAEDGMPEIREIPASTTELSENSSAQIPAVVPPVTPETQGLFKPANSKYADPDGPNPNKAAHDGPRRSAGGSKDNKGVVKRNPKAIVGHAVPSKGE